MKSSVVAITAAVLVATLIAGLKDREALQERFGFGGRTPELMMMGRIKGAGYSFQSADRRADRGGTNPGRDTG